MVSIQSFLKYLEFEKRSSLYTIKSYSCDLEQFLSYCEDKNINELSAVTTKFVRSWVVKLVEDGLAPKSVSRKITTLKSFFKFLMREGVVEISPVDGVVTPKIPKKLPIFVRDSEMNRLLDDVSFANDYEGVRDKLILELFYGSGMRLSELVSLTDKSFDLKEGVIRVTGKYKKDRMIPLYNGLITMIGEYKEKRDVEFGGGKARAFFLTAKGADVYHKLIYRVVNKYLGLVTTLCKKSPHVLRHSFATTLLNAGADLNAIKELLGHSNLNATEVYTHSSFEKITDIYNQAHPRS